MNKSLPLIESFKVDHRVLAPGLYFSRRDMGICTYDLRFKKPNAGDYISPPAIHAIEHLAASFLRAGQWRGNVIYFGPMGCRTGFYLLLDEKVSTVDLKELLEKTFAFIKDYEGEIPGASPKECGNYREMDLPAAKREAAEYLQVLINTRARDLRY
jgi:S-ribosylhomocysteine lyase